MTLVMDDTALCGLYDGCSQLERQVTMQYFDHLRNSCDAWKLCLTDFSERADRDDRVRFLCLQVLEHHVKTRYSTSSNEDILYLRGVLLNWLKPYQNGYSHKSFIKNKMAQIIALTFVNDYPIKWPQFFSNLLTFLNEHNTVAAIDIYLRILLAIDSEIVDREVIHTQEENIRNTTIKDYMRDTCVPQLVESWYQILSSPELIDHEVLCLVMSVIGSYVSWIDITLIANNKFVSLLLQYLSVPTLRESAADCLHDIINKGMEPLSKLELIESLVKLLERAGVFTLHEDDESGVDFQSKMSQLINGIGLALITSYQKLLKAGDLNNASLVLNAVEAKLPYMLHYLTDEDDGVSENVVNFATQYIVTLKHQINLSDKNSENIQAILYAVITKLKYDESYNFTNPGEDEGLFMEFRNKLRILFDNIAQLVPSLVLDVVKSLLSKTLSNLVNEPFNNIEVALLVFYYVADNNFEKAFGSAAIPESPFHEMTLLVVESDLSYHTHSAVLLQYYEAILRHDKFFSTSTQYIPQVIGCFLDHRGLRHNNPAVRSRLSYQFLRFIKSVRVHIGDIAEEVLGRIQDLLVMALELPHGKGLITGNDMLFLYENAGFLVAHSNRPPESKGELMNLLWTPLLEKFNYYLSELCVVTIPQQQDDISQMLHYILSYASRTSKVFPNYQTTQQSGCLQCFANALPVFLQGLQVTVHRDRLHSGVRQYLHRMIICLGDELLKYVPLTISLLLKDSESHDIQEFIPLINQLIAKYKGRIAPFLQEVFMPVVEAIITCLNRPFDPLDTEELRDRLNLQKSYFLFIHSLCVNEVTDIIANQSTQQLHDVLKTIVDGAKTLPDPSVKRTCFVILKKLVEAWAGDRLVDGFVKYSYEEILPVCFVAPLQQEFDLNDAQCFLGLGEIAGVLKALINHRGNEFLLYLQNEYLPSLQLPPDLSQELLIKLQQMDTKSLKPYLKALFIKIRTCS